MDNNFIQMNIDAHTQAYIINKVIKRTAGTTSSDLLLSVLANKSLGTNSIFQHPTPACLNLNGLHVNLTSFATLSVEYIDRKCLDLRGTRTPNLRIHAACSNHLSYQGQIFAASCLWILALAVCVCVYVCARHNMLKADNTCIYVIIY